MRNSTGRGSSSTRGFNARSWNPEKHLRDRSGRFKDNPNKPNKVSRSAARSTGNSARQLFKDAKDFRAIQVAKAEILATLSPSQRVRLGQAVKKRKPIGQPTPSTTKVKATRKKNDDGTETTTAKLPKPKKKRTPTARRVVSSDAISTSDNKVELWKGKGDEYLPQKGYKVKSQKGYEYAVEQNGKLLTLNNHKARVQYDGEVVNGLPPLTPNIRRLDNKRIVADMAKYAAYVEDKSNTPPAPNWLAQYGSPGKEYLSARGLGQMQLHHQNQWSRRNFKEITDRLEREEISLEQAKEQSGQLLRAFEKTNSKGEKVTKYEIAVVPKGDREFVVLAGGTHDFTSPLYKANHPLGVHPVTGKIVEFGIPESGRTTDGNRDEFNTFRGEFWRETYKREAKILSGELTRRLRKGEVTQEQVRELWQESRQKQADFRKYVLSLKKDNTTTTSNES